MKNKKIYKSFSDSVKDIKNGSSIMIGGFGGSGGQPTRLMLALRDLGLKNLIIISNVAGISVTTGYGWPKNITPVDQGIFFETKQVKKIICSFPVTGSIKPISEIEKSWQNGDCEVEIIPQGTLIERIRAAGAGIPAFYTPTGVGTIVAQNKEQRKFNNRTFLLEKALSADFALIRANRSDTFGNLEYIGTSRAFNPAMATASKITIAEVNEIVKPGEIDPEKIGTPGVYVNRIVKRKLKDPYP
ncbi:MAG: succinyl-CoA--3-ketoacid-CoA transferase [Chloroflexi bacterium]|nr:succinyl-CoA--3-ketoacid-CoA transferase [Chloroflexota bacterium]|tara:strand:+ start:642 stop:1373 length:732 start_codon:yes stop_codon:yes gene_type:complete